MYLSRYRESQPENALSEVSEESSMTLQPGRGLRNARESVLSGHAEGPEDKKEDVRHGWNVGKPCGRAEGRLDAMPRNREQGRHKMPGQTSGANVESVRNSWLRTSLMWQLRQPGGVSDLPFSQFCMTMAHG